MHEHPPAHQLQAWALFNRTRLFVERLGTDFDTIDVLMEILVLERRDGDWPTLKRLDANVALPSRTLRSILRAATLQQLVVRCDDRYCLLPETVRMLDFFNAVLCDDIHETARMLRSVTPEDDEDDGAAAHAARRVRACGTLPASSRKH